MMTNHAALLLLTLTLSLPSLAARAAPGGADAGAAEAQRIKELSDDKALALILDLVLGEAGDIKKLKKRQTHAYPYAVGKLAFSTKPGLDALEQRMVQIVTKNTGKGAEEAFQVRACELRARAQNPAFDEQDAKDACRNKRDLTWYLHGAEDPHMRGAMVLGLLEGKDVPDEVKRQTMDRYLSTLGYEGEKYLVDVGSDHAPVQHFRLRKAAPATWGRSAFRLGWRVAEQMPFAPKATLTTLKSAEKKAPKVRCRSWAVVLVSDFDGRRYTAPYLNHSSYAGGPDTEVKTLPCAAARKKRDKALLKVLKPDWDDDDGALIGAGPVKRARWIVEREYGKPVRKSKAVRVYVEEAT